MTYKEAIWNIKLEYPEFKSFLFNYEHRLLANETGHGWDCIICSEKSHYKFTEDEGTSVCYVHRIDDIDDYCTDNIFNKSKAIIYID